MCVDVRVRAECMGHAIHEAQGSRFQERKKKDLGHTGLHAPTCSEPCTVGAVTQGDLVATR